MQIKFCTFRFPIKQWQDTPLKMDETPMFSTSVTLSQFTSQVYSSIDCL